MTIDIIGVPMDLGAVKGSYGEALPPAQRGGELQGGTGESGR